MDRIIEITACRDYYTPVPLLCVFQKNKCLCVMCDIEIILFVVYIKSPLRKCQAFVFNSHGTNWLPWI